MERKKSEEFVKKVYERRGRSVARCKDRVKKYMHEGVDDRWGVCVWIGRGGGN